MLASPSTSRPRPPAQIRRTSSTNFERPPPPYPEDDPYDPMMESSSLPSIGGVLEEALSPPRTTYATSHEALPSPSDLRPAVHDVLNDRSREELQEMLLAAHNIIRKHEHDLTKAASETKYLRERNMVMKFQFEKLGRRHPQSPSMSSLVRSRSNSIMSSEDMVTPPLSPRKYCTPMRGHGRKSSFASPIALAQLADQNAELLNKLDVLQAETDMLDQAGKRKLRKLEKEIDSLRDELEQVQKRNIELEEEREEKEAQARREQELERRRLERGRRAGALRKSMTSRTLGLDDTDTESVRDFAPSSSKSSLSPSPIRLRTRPASSFVTSVPFGLDLDTYLDAATSPEQPSPDVDVPGTSSDPDSLERSPGETAIVIQLLGKIEELENANKEMSRQREEMAQRIQAAKEEVNTMGRAYQEAEEDIAQAELDGFPEEAEEGGEWVDEGARFVVGSMDSFKSDDLVHSSLRESRQSSPVKSLRKKSSKGSLRSLRSPRAIGNQRMMKKVRKPINPSMFLSPTSSPSDHNSPLLRNTNGPFYGPPSYSRNSRRLAAPDFSGTSPDKASSYIGSVRSDVNDPQSLRNIPSFGDMGRYMSALGLTSPRDASQTLENELGGEYSAEWNIDEEDLSREMFDALSVQGESSAGPLTSADVSFDSSLVRSPAPELREVDLVPMPNPAVAALQAALDPSKRGRVLEDGEHILPVGCLRDSPVETFYGLEQAVAARPTRWAELRSDVPLLTNDDAGRYEATPRELGSPEQVDAQERRRYQNMIMPNVDPWETTIYAPDRDQLPVSLSPSPNAKAKQISDSSFNTDDEDDSPKRRSALVRLNKTHMARRRRAHSHAESDDEKSYDIINADDQEGYENGGDAESKYDPKALAARIQAGSLNTFLEFWLILQFCLIIGVFVISALRQGPRAVMFAQTPQRGMIRKTA